MSDLSNKQMGMRDEKHGLAIDHLEAGIELG